MLLFSKLLSLLLLSVVQDIVVVAINDVVAIAVFVSLVAAVNAVLLSLKQKNLGIFFSLRSKFNLNERKKNSEIRHCS